jgi:hypothetical protein
MPGIPPMPPICPMNIMQTKHHDPREMKTAAVIVIPN